MRTQFNCWKHFYFKLFKQLYITIQFNVSTVWMSKTLNFKQFRLAYVRSLNVNTLLAIQFSQAVLIQLIQFSINTDFVYTQLVVNRVLC